MKKRDLANLLPRAAAALETPADLSSADKQELVEDLIAAAASIDSTDPESESQR